MRGMKPSLTLAALGVVGLALWANAYVDQTGSRMGSAASRYLTELDEKQVEQATFPFDSEERLNWHFIPRPRKGLPLKEMTSAQRRWPSACCIPAWGRPALSRPRRS